MPFELDPFQKEAIDWIQKGSSVLVCAPTGAGKTLIAENAIDQSMAHGENVIYTSPIKALSNQKFRDFKARYGEEHVGILTGDVSINPEAPLLIMTTEIYRNSLFENERRIANTRWVIFDEIHYLDDPERGTVWEEAILFTPPHIRMLALSATAPNINQLSDWIRSVHGRSIEVVTSNQRPVPLHFNFQSQGQILENMKELRSVGYLNRESWKITWQERRRGFHPWRAKPNRLDQLIEHLIQKDKFPAIYFVFGRRRAEYLAWESVKFDFLNKKEKMEIQTKYRELVTRYDLSAERSAAEMESLIENGIAYHHAGMLPTLKEVIEQLFTSRLIKLIFTTETFALGINMPARSVIFDELQKFYGTHFGFLTTRDFYQMAGRAGRRGMDSEGFVYIRVHPNDIPFPEVERVIYGKPEQIQSQFNTTYATLLNLFRNLGREALLKIYPSTFHYFQSYKKRRAEGAHLIERKLQLLQQMGYLAPDGLTDKGEFASSIFGYELMLGEMLEALEHLNEAELNVFLSSLIFEPRKGDHLPSFKAHHDRIKKSAEHHHKQIVRLEMKFRIMPHTKTPHFHLAKAVEAWTNGVPFAKLAQLTTADEGELVRHFRMVIQLLREILHAAHAPEKLRDTAGRAMRRINRGVVDAEKQLRT